MIAHHLRLIHEQLTEKVLGVKNHAPKWQVALLPDRVDEGKVVVEELEPIMGLALKLEAFCRILENNTNTGVPANFSSGEQV